MSPELTAIAVFGLLLVGFAIFRHYGPDLMLDLLDHVVWRVPIRPFLAVVPSQNPIVRSLVAAAAIVCGFGLALTLSRAAGFWIIWPVAVLVLYLAIGFGVAFATMWWPVMLTAGLLAVRIGFGWLDRMPGEPFADSGTIQSALNVMIAVTFIVASYATVVSQRARGQV